MSISAKHHPHCPFVYKHYFFQFTRIARFHVQMDKHLLSGTFLVESIEFACLANCFYIQCSSLTTRNFYTAFRILEAIDYFYAKELNDAVSQPDAITGFLKNFACAFGVFRALQSCISGDATIKKLCLVPFLSIILMRTNAKSKELSENCQSQLYSAFHHSIESFKLVECIANFALEANELQLMTQYRQALHCVDVNMVDVNSRRYPAKKHQTLINRLTTRIAANPTCDLPRNSDDAIFLKTSRSFVSRRFDEEVRALE